MTKEMREEVCLSFATKRNMTEGSGCKFEKNSVNCPCKDGDNMPVPKEKRDYAKEYAREKANGTRRKKQMVGAHVELDKAAAFDAKLALTGDTKNALINKWIDMYLAGTLK